MRMLMFALVAAAMVSPCSARTILKSEPLLLAPYEVAYVQGASCPAGEVLRVTGAIRGLDRKRVCVALDIVQTSLVLRTDRLGDVIDREAAGY